MNFHVMAIICFLLLFRISLSAETWSDSCLDFSTPDQGSIISSQTCTLLVETSCRNIKKVDFQARYFPSGSDTGIVTTLGSVSRSPYQYVWDISKIPNQILGGVSFLAEATLYNGRIYEVKREGVFFTHQTIERPSVNIPYEHSGVKTIKMNPFQFESPRSTMAITAAMYWNEKDITVLVEVKDPQFFANISHETMASMGVEILIDPSMSKKPYPEKDILIYAVPLYGKPYRIIYKPEFDKDGSFKLNSVTKPCDFNSSVTKEDFKGFKIYFPIPRRDLFTTLPEKMSLNLIVKTVKEGTSLSRTPWIKSNLLQAYSPFVWGHVQFQPKPVYKNRLLVWGVFFAAGLLITLIMRLVLFSFTKSRNHGNESSSEAEQRIFDKAKESVEQRITQKNTTIELVARDIRISPKALNFIIKKFTGMSFHNYVMFSKIEIAKERLRSSHCSESSIAEACGFHNANELEKYFVKFYHITPYKFRMEQQVA